jgi:AcrR family transcriptional regulator
MHGDRPAEPKRPYVSAVRAEQAASTRARIAHAAGECFAEGGWSGTTVAQIARSAGVTPQAVHLSIGPKPALIKAALVAAVGAGEAESPQLEQEVFGAALAPGLTVEQRADAYARATYEVHQRAGKLFAVLAQAAQTDEDLAAWRQSIQQRRVALCRALVSACGFAGRKLNRSRDLVFVATSTSVYYEFEALGWSGRAYLAWLVDSLVEILAA